MLVSVLVGLGILMDRVVEAIVIYSKEKKQHHTKTRKDTKKIKNAVGNKII